MDILPIQASSVPCERVFSSAKETMTPRRNHISTKMMEALQILKYSLRYGHNLNFMEGLNWDDELTEMESSHRVHLHIPEDFDSFIVNIGDAASDSDSDVDDSV